MSFVTHCKSSASQLEAGTVRAELTGVLVTSGRFGATASTRNTKTTRTYPGLLREIASSERTAGALFVVDPR